MSLETRVRFNDNYTFQVILNPVTHTILYYTILYYTILYYTILYYTILYYTILCYAILILILILILVLVLCYSPLQTMQPELAVHQEDVGQVLA